MGAEIRRIVVPALSVARLFRHYSVFKAQSRPAGTHRSTPSRPQRMQTPRVIGSEDENHAGQL